MVSKKSTKKIKTRNIAKEAQAKEQTKPGKKGKPKAKARNKEEEEEASGAELMKEAGSSAAESDGERRKVPKTKANRLAEMADEDDEEEEEEPTKRGIVFIASMPEAMDEPVIKGYFEQFGTLTNLKLCRSIKTGNSKRYGYIEYEDEEVAKIVVQTMNGYMVGGRKLFCSLVTHLEGSQIFTRLRGVGLLGGFTPMGPRRRKADAKNVNDRPEIEVDGEKLPQQTLRQIVRRNLKVKKLQDKLENLGIEYDLSPFALGRGNAEVEAAMKEKEEEDAELTAETPSRFERLAKAPEGGSRRERKVRAAADVVQKLNEKEAKKATSAAAADSAATTEAAAEADRGEAAKAEEEAQPPRKGKKARKAQSEDAVDAAAAQVEKEKVAEVEEKQAESSAAADGAASTEVGAEKKASKPKKKASNPKKKASSNGAEPAAPAADDGAGTAEVSRPKKKKRRSTE